MTSSYSIFGATITLPGETEAGSAGKRPCRGIAWWAHRNDDWSVELSLLRSSKSLIGSVDPDALKIPARRAESTLTESARLPFHAEPGQSHQSKISRIYRKNVAFSAHVPRCTITRIVDILALLPASIIKNKDHDAHKNGLSNSRTQARGPLMAAGGRAAGWHSSYSQQRDITEALI